MRITTRVERVSKGCIPQMSTAFSPGDVGLMFFVWLDSVRYGKIVCRISRAQRTYIKCHTRLRISYSYTLIEIFQAFKSLRVLKMD